jgi:thioredoxin domain-containing protein 5
MVLVKLNNNNVNAMKLSKLLKNGTTFVGVFSKTCPHCVNMQSEWKKFISSVNEKKMKATILEIDSNTLSSIKHPLINNNVQGFPSLFIIKNNKFITQYNQERKANNFLQFLNKYISKQPLKHTKKARPLLKNYKSSLTMKNRHKSL